MLNCFGINYAIQTYFVEDINNAKNNYQQIASDALKLFGSDASEAIAFFDKKFHIIN
jgi:hypothetical protein